MRSNARCYDELFAYVAALPVVDCHDHGRDLPACPTDPIAATLDWYMQADLESAVDGWDLQFVLDAARPLEARWVALEPAWKRARFTGYGLVVRRGLQMFYGEDDLSLEALRRIAGRLIDLSTPAAYEAMLDQANIRARIADVWSNADAIAGTLQLPPRTRLAFSLPQYHRICRYEDVQANARPLKRTVTCLDEYLDVCREAFTRMKANGAVCFKDQSAYDRTIHFGNPTRAEAEAAFNWMMEDPRRALSYPDGNQPLGDYLFHQFMRMARDLDMPVQIHTGHMAGIYNNVVKANASGLTSVLELHKDTRFDLFHANWPYSGDLLFLGKNYPNVTLDFCWTHMVDPLYAQQMLKQAVSSMPHAKIHGYGSDLAGNVLPNAMAHLAIARENIAIALAELVEADYLGLEDAKEIARGWLFDNPNEFFRLAL